MNIPQASYAFGKWEPPTDASLSDDEICTALLKSKGRTSEAALLLGTSGNFLRYRIRTSPDLQALINEISNVRIDNAESVLDQAIAQGPTQLGLQGSLFVLRTKGAERGYITRTEHTGKDGSPLAPIDPQAQQTTTALLTLLTDLATQRAGDFKRGGPLK